MNSLDKDTLKNSNFRLHPYQKQKSEEIYTHRPVLSSVLFSGPANKQKPHPDVVLEITLKRTVHHGS